MGALRARGKRGSNKSCNKQITNKDTHRSIFRQVEKDEELDKKWDKRAAELAQGGVSGKGSCSSKPELPQEREEDTRDVDNVVYLK